MNTLTEAGDDIAVYSQDIWDQPHLDPLSPAVTLPSGTVLPSPPFQTQEHQLQLQCLKQQMLQQQQIIEQLQASLTNTQDQFKVMWHQFTNHQHIPQTVPVQASDAIPHNQFPEIINNHFGHNNITLTLAGKDLSNQTEPIELVTNTQYIFELKHVPPKSHFIVSLEPLAGCILLIIIQI